MRESFPEIVEAGRVRRPPFNSNRGDKCGAFFILGQTKMPRHLKIIASDASEWPFEGSRWEHVSVSVADRANVCPSWDEMNFVKGLFWAEDECVIQFHPAKSEYVNNHPGCLHLWKIVDAEFPIPPSMAVGIKA